MKYCIIFNKSIDGDVYPFVMINKGIEINDLHQEYNTQVRDKYDPIAFVEWLRNVHSVKVWTPKSTTFTKNYDTAYRFNFHNPIYPKRSRIKKVRFARSTKTPKR